MRIFTRHLAGVFAGMSLLVSSGVQAQDVTLKLHQFLPAQANVPKLILDVWADNVEEASAGRIKVDRYPSMQLGGKPPELMDQAIDGVADIVWTVVGYTPGRFPRTEVFEMPFMMSNAEATSRAYWEMFETHMRDTEFKNLKILGTWVHGPGLIHSKEPITLPADLNGVKVRGGSRTVNKLMAELGATPVGMPVPAVPEGLSKGVVLAMNKPKYDSLPADLQKVIDDNSGLEFSMFAGKTQEGADGPSRQLAVDNGNNIITLNEEQVAAWEEASSSIVDAWVADMEGKGIDGQALVDEARMLIEKYSQ